VGNLVKANDTTYLVQLNQITPIYVAFSIPEPRLNEVRQYSASGRLKVLAYPNGQPSSAAEGHLTFIDNGVDPQTGMVALKATFPNADGHLWPGQFLNVVLNLYTVKNAVVVPTKAVQSGQQGDYVYVITSQNTAEARNITPAGTFRDLTLVAKGLSPSERVVVNGQLRVVPNGKVAVQNASSEANNAGAAGGSL
jgi:multidrug efflux system membrane fusion protein